MNLTEQEPQPSEEVYRIPLTRGQSAIVDSIDYHSLIKWNWIAHWNTKTKSFYAVRNVTVETGKYACVVMSREIMQAPHGVLVDHRNHDTLDNRRQNLRFATNSQNGFNRRIDKRNNTGFKGVARRGNYFRALIRVNGKLNHLGQFKTPEEAHAAYVVAALKYAGEFAFHGE